MVGIVFRRQNPVPDRVALTKDIQDASLTDATVEIPGHGGNRLGLRVVQPSLAQLIGDVEALQRPVEF